VSASQPPSILMHISDLHFHRLPSQPARYLSKRALGALNLALWRRRAFPLERAQRLVERLLGLEWQHLLITGDLTQLGTPEEFALAREVLAPLLARGPERVTVIPGNHDRYVAEPPGVGAFEAAFGAFGAFATGEEVLTRRLAERWWLVAWDSARPAPWFSAAGRVRAETLAATERWLAGLPAGAQVIVANHYPAFFPPPHRHVRSHGLANQRAVTEWLLRQPVRLYLHGHIHQNWVHTVNGAHGPLTSVNSASSTQRPRQKDRSAFHRVVLEDNHARIEPLRVEE